MRVDPSQVRLSEFRRVGVCGTSGVGKSTLANRIGRLLGLPVIEMDSIHWRPNWTECPLEEFLAEIDARTSGEAWVLDGNYGKARHITGPRLDLVIWLDYGFWTTLARLLKRTVRRSATREELWPGCRENWRTSFFSRESILWWMISTHRRRRAQVAEFASDPTWAHIKLLSFRSPRDLEAWLARQENR